MIANLSTPDKFKRKAIVIVSLTVFIPSYMMIDNNIVSTYNTGCHKLFYHIVSHESDSY
jgi:hypothetical protein